VEFVNIVKMVTYAYVYQALRVHVANLNVSSKPKEFDLFVGEAFFTFSKSSRIISFYMKSYTILIKTKVLCEFEIWKRFCFLSIYCIIFYSLQ